MEIIFGIEELISEGIMSMEEGDEIMKEAREVITTEQLLYRKRKDEIEKAYNEYVEQINAKDLPPECKEILISPGRDIVSLVYEVNRSNIAITTDNAYATKYMGRTKNLTSRCLKRFLGNLLDEAREKAERD